MICCAVVYLLMVLVSYRAELKRAALVRFRELTGIPDDEVRFRRAWEEACMFMQGDAVLWAVFWPVRLFVVVPWRALVDAVRWAVTWLRRSAYRAAEREARSVRVEEMCGSRGYRDAG